MDLRKLQALLGVVPLTGFLVFHLWEMAAASSGRHAFLARMTGVDGSVVAIGLESLVVLVPLAAHAVIGFSLVLRDREVRREEPGTARGLRTIHLVTGAGALLFVLWHLSHTWVARLGGADGGEMYDLLRHRAGQTPYLIAYVVGITCVCYHAAQGLAFAARTLGVVRTDGGHRAVRVLGVLVGVALWVAALDTFGYFATGKPLFRAGGGAQTVAPAPGAQPQPARGAPQGSAEGEPQP